MSEEIEQPDVTVKFSRELVEKLADWSEPVHVKVVPDGAGGHTLDIRRVNVQLTIVPVED